MFMYKILFFNMLIISTFIAISSYNWLGMWMGLEINLMSFIPLMKSKNLYSSESSIKYFITQALASTLILFTIILFNNKYLINLSSINYLMMNIALLTKMGAAPFHFWFPEISEGINWINNLILLTWQKITPMLIMMYNSYMNIFFIMIIMFCMMISSLMGLNQISLRKIMVFSSINNIGWMIPSIMFSQSIWFIYFLIYSLLNMNLIFIFMFYNFYYFNQFNYMNKLNNYIKIIMFLNFLNLGGLPPFMGFYSKWLTINLMLLYNLNIIALLMILFTLIVLYYYIRMFYMSLTLNTNMKMIKIINNKFFYMSFILLSMSPMIYLM
uniref:NADH-ubiquinone oxidoreductase chain 2 n=1 Tax=Coleoptera sp. ACP-2013 TaxID=2485033 RepID=A0A3G3MEQ3_9COLE|nr:NADH dehydrogenase subunit 2 [Coleoptera sp. ACP-2013]